MRRLSKRTVSRATPTRCTDGAQSSRRYIAERHVAVPEAPCLLQPHLKLVLETVEYRSPLANHDRKDDDLVLVDQSLLRQLRHDAAAAQDRNVLPGLFLQLP